MSCVIVLNKLNINFVYFQYTAEVHCSIKGSSLYVGLNVTDKINYISPSIMITTLEILHM